MNEYRLSGQGKIIIVKNVKILVICIIILIPAEISAFWNTCIKIDRDNTSIWVVDPDIMGVKNFNTNEFAFVSIDCPEDSLHEHPFSKCANGCPLYPASSIKLSTGRDKICESDAIFIYKKRCKVSHMEKGKDR
jgi:hypothetical protein